MPDEFRKIFLFPGSQLPMLDTFIIDDNWFYKKYFPVVECCGHKIFYFII